MNSADYAIPFQSSWSVAVPIAPPVKAAPAAATTSSIIDDLVAQRESREMIPKTEVTMGPATKPNPLYYEPELPDDEYNGAGIPMVRAAGRKTRSKPLGFSNIAPKPLKAQFGNAAELDNMFNRMDPLNAAPARRKKRSMF